MSWSAMWPKKILLVDDSETALLLEKMILRSGDYQILTAQGGEEALQIALVEHPDLILLDLIMPDPDGLEVCRRIRSEESIAGVPIIMVTTRADEGAMDRAYAVGCTAYITKPIDGLELLSKVRSYLGEVDL
jgi:CheY-like chemotaxis protein